ncbi:hypothetical protein [Marinicrinis lubricantis]|uniref:hypothetical protein n=1 Tax=Marinicrinis lubricantis TaxID=2086470 RepID=UPI0039F09C2A
MFEQTPPFFIQHGTMDPIIPVKQSVIFYEKLLWGHWGRQCSAGIVGRSMAGRSSRRQRI